MATSTSTQHPVKDGSENKKRIPALSILAGILFLTLWGCRDTTQSDSDIRIRWQDSIPTGLIIPRKHLADIPDDSIDILLKIHVAGTDAHSAVFGEYNLSKNSVVFEPLIPFTRGLDYEVRFRDETIQTIRIPSADPSSGPRVLAIYPHNDTVPENLLKIYIQFSKPMRESNPLHNIQLLQGTDTVRQAFLDLRPALWNRDGTLLTLWLDPGRIKRDLQPHNNLGTPLQEGNAYRLVIQPGWPAKNGAHLMEGMLEKVFVAGPRDSVSPELHQWQVQVPKVGTRDPLRIIQKEMLDLILMQEAIDVVDAGGRRVEGNIETENKKTSIVFIPLAAWQKGTYFLLCEARIEDLAGNNLNRLFEEDLKAKKTKASQDLYKIPFKIK